MKGEIAERLRDATQDAERSIRSVQQELKAAGVPGSSYANIHSFFQGKSQPSVEFLEAAAGALGVRPEWLAFGTKPRTEEGARLAHAQEEGELERREADHRRELRAAFTRGFPPFTRIGALARTAIVEVANRIAVYSDSFSYEWNREVERPELPGVWNLAGPEHDLERAEAVGRLFSTPFEALDMDPRTLRALDRYVLLQAQALLTMIPDRARGEEGAQLAVNPDEPHEEE